MALWNTTDSGIRPRAVRDRSRWLVTRRRPICRPYPEALEDRCLLATTYSITDIVAQLAYATPQGFPDYWVGINNASPAQVVAGEGPDGKAFVWDSVHGSKDLGTVNKEANSVGIGINDSGKVVGTSWTTTVTYPKKGFPIPITKTVENGFGWTAGGGMSDLGSGVGADAINNSGEIMGSNSLWNGKTWTPLGDLPGGIHSIAMGLNNDGQVVGTMFDLGTLATNADPPDSQSEGMAINSSGVVVGYSGQTGAVIWQPDAGGTYTMSDLNSLIPSGTGWKLSEAHAINDNGLIVAYGSQNGGPGHYLLLTPQTTATAPAALAMPATAPGPIRSPAEPTAASIRIGAVAPNGLDLGGQPGPTSPASRIAAQPAALSIFDFALADLVAHLRPKTAANGGTVRPTWGDPGTS